MSNFNKQAVDEAAKKYWSDLFADYGKTLVRDIPLKVKAALQKSAGLDEKHDGVVLPIVGFVSDDGTSTFEGLYKSTDLSLAFKATVAKDGTVQNLDHVAV